MAARQGGPQVRDLTRTTFAVIFICLLLGTSLWILRPFLGPMVWATMVVVATWPVMQGVQRVLWGRRALAVAVMTLLLLLLLVVPLVFAIITIVGNADRLADWAKLAADYHLPESPPAWVLNLPMVGATAERAWQQAAEMGLRDLVPKLSPYAGDATRWFVAQVGSIGLLLFHFLITVVIAAVMYSSGEQAADKVSRFARRLAGERGAGAVKLAGGAIRGVALGVGVTALVQAVLGGLGVALAGVPFAGLLAALMFMLCIAQIGPMPVLLGAVVWAYYNTGTGWVIFLAIVTLVVGTLDNFLRPFLIKRGADLPLLLIFAGVIGGLIAFGLVGIFVGPVMLAVGYTLLEAWVADGSANGPEFRD